MLNKYLLSNGEGNGNPLQYSCLLNPKDRGAWQATVHGVERVGHDLATKPPPPNVLHSRSEETLYKLAPGSASHESRRVTKLIHL